jgi:hypothetical protein
VEPGLLEYIKMMQMNYLIGYINLKEKKLPGGMN